MDREKIMQRFEQDLERLTAGLILDKIAQAEDTGQKQLTDFLDPFQLRTADRVLYLFKGIKSVRWGGFAEAERARLLLFPSVVQATTADIPLAFVQAAAGASGHSLTHRDFLGALLGLGLRREKIGDLIISEPGTAQVVLHPEITPFVLSNWQEAGKYKINASALSSDRLYVQPAQVKDVATTVASLRLDAVAGSGFGVSRSKLAPAIRAGQVRLNWQSVKNASAAVKEGDVISLSGRGRVEVAEIRGESKKGRIHLLLKKYS